MKELIGENIGAFPFKQINKVSDLIYFEGPVLSHFKDKYGKDILFYWVDSSPESNRWLIFQVEETLLYRYLLKNKSLKSLLFSPSNDVFYTVEIGSKFQYDNIVQIFKEDLNPAYIPEDNSFYESPLPTYYNNKIRQYEEDFFTEMALEKAVYVKAQPKKKKDKSIRHLVGLSDGSSLLGGYGKSWEGFVAFNVLKKFIEIGIPDAKRIKIAIKQLLYDYQPNIIQVQIKSFAVAFSPFGVGRIDEIFLDKKWRDELFEAFKVDVVDVDKKSLEEIDELLKNYGGNHSHDIYKPLIELYNNENIVINITDKNFNPTRTITPLQKDIIRKLISKKPNEIDEPIDRLALVKYDPISNKIKGVANATLFDQSIQTSWCTDAIRTGMKIYNLRMTLYANYKKMEGLEIVENKFLGIYASGEDLNEAEVNFYNEFHTLYESIISVENSKLTAEQIEIKNYLTAIVKK